MTDFDDNFISLADAENLAHGTGQYRGVTVEFSDDGQNWVEAWMPSDAHPVPELARATVLRKLEDDDIVPTRATVRWAEYVPSEDDDRHANWMKMPTTLLGKVAKVSALRGAFRDVIGERYEPAELDQAGGAQQRRRGRGIPTPKPATEDWEGLIELAETADDVREIDKEMRSRHEGTEELNRLLAKRLADLEPKKPARGRKS